MAVSLKVIEQSLNFLFKSRVRTSLLTKSIVGICFFGLLLCVDILLAAKECPQTDGSPAKSSDLHR